MCDRKGMSEGKRSKKKKEMIRGHGEWVSEARGI